MAQNFQYYKLGVFLGFPPVQGNWQKIVFCGCWVPMYGGRKILTINSDNVVLIGHNQTDSNATNFEQSKMDHFRKCPSRVPWCSIPGMVGSWKQSSRKWLSDSMTRSNSGAILMSRGVIWKLSPTERSPKRRGGLQPLARSAYLDQWFLESSINDKGSSCNTLILSCKTKLDSILKILLKKILPFDLHFHPLLWGQTRIRQEKFGWQCQNTIHSCQLRVGVCKLITFGLVQFWGNLNWA